MLDRVKQNQLRALSKKLLEGEKGRALIAILTEAERALVESVQEQHDALGIESIDELPTPEDRAEELRQAALAKVDGRFPEYVVETYLADRLDHAGEAAQFADMDVDEWEEQKAQWARDYREQGMDATDEALVEAHLRSRYGVDLDTFEELVVEWSDGREGGELENIIADGLRTAKNGIERTTSILEAADVDGSEVLEENDVVVSDP